MEARTALAECGESPGRVGCDVRHGFRAMGANSTSHQFSSSLTSSRWLPWVVFPCWIGVLVRWESRVSMGPPGSGRALSAGRLITDFRPDRTGIRVFARPTWPGSDGEEVIRVRGEISTSGVAAASFCSGASTLRRTPESCPRYGAGRAAPRTGIVMCVTYCGSLRQSEATRGSQGQSRCLSSGFPCGKRGLARFGSRVSMAARVPAVGRHWDCRELVPRVVAPSVGATAARRLVLSSALPGNEIEEVVRMRGEQSADQTAAALLRVFTGDRRAFSTTEALFHAPRWVQGFDRAGYRCDWMGGRAVADQWVRPLITVRRRSPTAPGRVRVCTDSRPPASPLCGSGSTSTTASGVRAGWGK